MTGQGYVGRFAPSPSGPLHFGSMVAAVGSWLDARAAGGHWLLRLDDLDRPRNAPGAARAILAELNRLGLQWDGDVTRQSDDEARYRAAAAHLRAQGLAYPCACSRQALVDGVYPGNCRAGLPPGRRERSLRLRVDDRPRRVDDAVQGPFVQRLESSTGDFVLLRADGVIAYHLATVVDDAAAGVTHVVRGADLLHSTPRQMALQEALGLAHPRYAHLPVVTGGNGQKLSKQNHARATTDRPIGRLWRDALAFLGQDPPAGIDAFPLKAITGWAIDHWNRDAVPARSDRAPGDVA